MAFVSPTPARTLLRRARPQRSSSRMPVMKLSVLVTGATGRTGRLVLERLLSQPEAFSATGLVRSIAAAKDAFPDHPSIGDALTEGDVTNPDSLRQPIAEAEALVILSSAVPRINPTQEGAPPSFYFDEGGMPEQVDWHGAKNLIDLGRAAGVSHIVLVGSMGSTDENDMLNRVGNGNILRFKRKAELYLIDSGVPYTIVNPAGLRNEPPGERELVVGNSDQLFSIFSRGSCSIPRADVARIVVAALTADTAKNKAFDVVGRPKGDGTPTEDVSTLFESTGPDL